MNREPYHGRDHKLSINSNGGSTYNPGDVKEVAEAMLRAVGFGNIDCEVYLWSSRLKRTV